MGRVLLALGALVVTASPSSAQTEATEDKPKENPQTRIQLESLLVEGKRSPTARTIPSRSQAREELRKMPGNTQLIGSETYRKERVGNLETVLENAAGVYIQSRFGGSETRLSIRGSGITQTFESRGVRILRNGLPLTQADGFTRSQLVDPLIVQRAEVLPGANALEYGVATLGGAVNLVTPTGYTADRLSAHLEGGSDAWGRAQIASGQVLGQSGLDYYASLSGLHQDGFREANDDEESGQFYGNVGFRSSEDTEHRLHLTYLQQDLELPGSLTEEQIEDNPEQPNELWQRSRSQRNFDILRLDWQTSTRLGEATTVDLGTSWQHEDMFHPLPAFQFGPGTADSQVIESDRDDFSINARAKSSLDGLRWLHELTYGGRAAYGEDETDFFVSDFGTTAKGAKARTEEGEASTIELFFEDHVSLSEAWSLIIGGQWTHAGREVQTNQIDPGEPLGGGLAVGFTGGKEDYSQFNPRLGFTWQAHPGVQIFGNFSRSFEPPSLAELADSTGETLDAQEAWTAELGTRGRWHRLSWQLAGFYAWLNDEILIVETPPGTGNFEANNADDTVHAGTELSLTYRQPLGWWGKDALTLQANHTWNEFHFDNDPTFGDNVLPGIPEHVIRANVTYRHPSGFYLTPSVNAAAGDAFVDFANTLENDSFAIVNLRTGFDHPSGWSIFVEGKNLADKEFASNTRVIADASASFGDPAAFNPGRPRSVFAGIEVSY